MRSSLEIGGAPINYIDPCRSSVRWHPLTISSYHIYVCICVYILARSHRFSGINPASSLMESNQRRTSPANESRHTESHDTSPALPRRRFIHFFRILKDAAHKKIYEIVVVKNQGGRGRRETPIKTESRVCVSRGFFTE